MISTLFLALAVQDPQPTVTSRIATPPMIIATAGPLDPAIPIEVHITAGDRLLFSDTLLVARGAGASYSQSRSEASPAPCPENLSYNRSQQTSLNIQLYWQDSGSGGPGTNVSVQWQRPQGGSDCAPIGTRGVQISQMVRLTPGESATIKGDAGLTVRLTRR